jgi:hypothetical protein
MGNLRRANTEGQSGLEQRDSAAQGPVQTLKKAFIDRIPTGSGS